MKNLINLKKCYTVKYAFGVEIFQSKLEAMLFANLHNSKVEGVNV